MNRDLNAIVLAAGKGTRMGTAFPKVVHPVAGLPMLARVLQALESLALKQTRVVVGEGAPFITPIANKYKALCFQQETKYWGTAKAVASARPEELKGDVLILSGDHPLITSKDLMSFVEKSRSMNVDCTVGAFEQREAGHYGQLIMDKNRIKKIKEHYEKENPKERNTERKSALLNTGLYFIKTEVLKKWLDKISKNQNGEYNFTEILSIIYEEKGLSHPVSVPWNTAWGVNNQKELAVASQYVFNLKRDELMRKGVIFIDASQTYVESEVTVGSGTVIYPGAYLKGRTKIGSFCAIEPHVFITDSIVSNFVNLRAGSYIEEAEINEKTIIGPYAHLRKGSRIGKECRIGNFVETKNLSMGEKSKAAHLSYLGDVEIGKNTNIGCGTVTCNYGVDGKKRKTIIKDKVFVGSGSQLVAPLTIESEAVIGAGSVITKDVPEKSLSLERGEQVIIKNYKKKS